MVGRNIISAIETAHFEAIGGEKLPAPVFDYGATRYMEIPSIVLLDDGMYRLVRIVVIREHKRQQVKKSVIISESKPK